MPIGGAVRWARRMVSTCYFLLNYASDEHHLAFLLYHREKLAIFFWIMPRGTPTKMCPTGRWGLAIFFWIMLWVKENICKLCWHEVSCYFLLNYACCVFFRVFLVVFFLLFSFELCVCRKLKENAIRYLETLTCYFLLNYATSCYFLCRVVCKVFILAIFFWIMLRSRHCTMHVHSLRRPCYFLLNYALPHCF